jgi:hypothetical protein
MGWETWAGLIWLRIEAGNKPPGFIKWKDIFDYLKADRLLWNDSAPVSPLKGMVCCLFIDFKLFEK